MLRILFYIAVFTLPKLVFGQEANLIIQLNEKLVQGGFTNMYVTLDSAKSKQRFPVDYVPGNLRLNDKVITALKMDSTQSLFLHFSYNTYKKQNQQTAHFYAKLTQMQLQQPYLILNIYDFRDRKYRNWYQRSKEQEFVSELVYPNSGILIRNR